MYKAIFTRRNSSDVYAEIEETNADITALINTVFTNSEGIDKHHFLEDLCCRLYQQVDGEYVELTSGSEIDSFKSRWDSEYNG